MSQKLNLDIDHFNDSPFFSIISFHKVIDALTEIAKEDQAPYRAVYAQSLLTEVAKVPELYDGITSKKIIYDNLSLIQNLLADLFPTALTANEIKAVSLPFQNFNFNFTQRFQNIINEAGDEFEINIRDFTNEQYYIFSCCLILNTHYGEHFDISRPLFYDIPDKNGIIRHYRITYNGDFCELIPTNKAVKITTDDIKLLKNSFDNVEIWKEKFPQHSWILKGFGILTLFDVTIENSISKIKTNLLKSGQEKLSISIAQDIFRSLFKLKDINFGIFFIHADTKSFIELTTRVELQSIFNLLDKKVSKDVVIASQIFFNSIEKDSGYYCVTDILELYDTVEWIPYLDYLQNQGVRSFILAPVRQNDGFQAYIELFSSTPYTLHTINANKLNDVVPLLSDTFERYNNEIKNEVDAIIQREYTTIHPSVNWKFQQEAEKIFSTKNNKKSGTLKEIVFENVFPLYGETDIQASTKFRNKAQLADLQKQLKEILNILEFVKPNEETILFEQRINEIIYFQNQLKTYQFAAETKVQMYITNAIHPLFKQLYDKSDYKKIIKKYNEQLDEKQQRFWRQRKKCDAAIQTINKQLTDVLDAEQIVLQKVYPHYFERFRSDGVEHNLFIGSSITPNKIYDSMYLYNLRLWQLQIMCKVVMLHCKLKPNMAFDMNLTSLILAYNEPIAIKFRMDEKKFDVANDEDIRFELIKKRLDKAMVKNTNDRLVQANKLSIVYLNEADKSDYLNYIEFLISKNYFIDDIEFVTVEDLQDINDLKAIRITINTDFNLSNFSIFTYTDFVNYVTKY